MRWKAIFCVILGCMFVVLGTSAAPPPGVPPRCPDRQDGQAPPSAPQPGERPQAENSLESPLPEGAIMRLGTTRFRMGGNQFGGNLRDLHVSPDGTLIVTTGLDNGMMVWESATGKLLHNLQDKYYHSVYFSHDGKHLLIPGTGGVSILDPSAGKVEGTIKAEGYISHIALSPDDRMIVMNVGARLELREFTTGRLVRSVGYSAGT